MKNLLLIVLIIAASLICVQAQSETLSNTDIVDMSRSGLSKKVILKKIKEARSDFDLSAKALVELKSAGVDDEVIAFMLEIQDSAATERDSIRNSSAGTVTATMRPSLSKLSENDSLPDVKSSTSRPASISFTKSSIQPSRQALEKELLRRKDFRDLNLTILRYKEQADLYVEIGFVSGSIITHRYVYRIYDRRTGAVIAAGETTSWGSLAENLAKHIVKSITTALSGNTRT